MELSHPVSELQTALAAADVANAKRMIAALERYIEARTPRMTRRAEWALFEVCNAGIALVDDGDFCAQRDVLMHELGVDEEGYPDAASPYFDPARVHPNDACQSKGYGA